MVCLSAGMMPNNRSYSMAATTHLTYDQFREHFRNGNRDRYEFWYGEAIPRSMHTVVHGVLQKIIMQLLDCNGFTSASEVEVRIDPAAHPLPDVIASRTKLPPGPYLIQATEIVVEIISANDAYVALREKCRSYQAWDSVISTLCYRMTDLFWSGETARLSL